MRLIIFILFLLAGLLVKAQVNIKNGNFHVSYTDATFKGTDGAIEKIQRTYNSKSTQIGWFGYGWGSRLETNLAFYPDGNVRVREYGAGEKNIFTSGLQDDMLAEEMIDAIIDIELEKNIIKNTPVVVAQRRETYFNLNDRYNAYDIYLEKGYIEIVEIAPDGMTWQSFNRGDQQLVFQDDNFVRTNRSGEKEYFDLKGNMVKYELKNGNYTKIIFEKGKVSKLINKNGQVVNLMTTDKGYINKISYNYDDRKQEAILKYENDNLIFSEDTSGYQYKFVYDNNHNMTRTIYNPVRLPGIQEDARYMFYQDKTSYLIKLIERDSSNIKEYAYKTFYDKDGNIDDDHYSTEISILEKGYDKPSISSYEYFIGTRADGSRFTQKIVSTSKGYSKSETYDETCTNNPIRIEAGNRWTTFNYDKNCNLIEKQKSTGEYLRLKHHPTLKKMTEVQQDDNLFIYDYDQRGNIIYGKKNDEPAVHFTYNDQDKIMTMKNGEKLLKFEYNKIGKPTKITIDTVGSINVTYDSAGEIDQVESEDGAQMAIQVTQTFQNLLSIVKPANLNYNL